MLRVRLLDDGPVVGEPGHVFPRSKAWGAPRRVGPVGLEVEFLVGMSEAVEIMRGAEIRLDVAPEIGLQRLDVAMAALLQGHVDQLARRHLEAWMHRAEMAGQALKHLVIAAAFAGRVDQLRADRYVLVSAAVIEIVML